MVVFKEVVEKQGTHESGGDCQTQSEDREMGWRRFLGARTVYSKPAYFKNIYTLLEEFFLKIILRKGIVASLCNMDTHTHTHPFN